MAVLVSYLQGFAYSLLFDEYDGRHRIMPRGLGPQNGKFHKE